jgi:sec-independent protein translocase protein TatA
MNIPVNIEIIQYAGFIGTPEIVIIVVVVLLLFGGKKIPELMKGIGKGVKEFKDGISGQEEKKESGDASSTKENK